MNKSAYSGVAALFKKYWQAYGGAKAIYSSPYFHLSIVITIISYGTWIKPDWVNLPISVLPNIIGFSLGGYAIWLTIGDEKFRSAISGDSDEGKKSPFYIVNATFVHFIFLQIISLLYSLVVNSSPISSLPLALKQKIVHYIPYIHEIYIAVSLFASGVGFLIFIYALLTALAATMAIFRIGGWLDIHQAKKK
jgi:hypothetical protein